MKCTHLCMHLPLILKVLYNSLMMFQMDSQTCRYAIINVHLCQTENSSAYLLSSFISHQAVHFETLTASYSKPRLYSLEYCCIDLQFKGSVTVTTVTGTSFF
jgi:hypothetical protein